VSRRLEEPPAVLRITAIDHDGGTSNRTLKLEGKILGSWVDESAHLAADVRRPRFDMSFFWRQSMRSLLRCTVLAASVFVACWGIPGCSTDTESAAGKMGGPPGKMDTGKMSGAMDKMDTGKMSGAMDKMDTGKMSEAMDKTGPGNMAPEKK
jgi:hypothetical protein